MKRLNKGMASINRKTYMNKKASINREASVIGDFFKKFVEIYTGRFDYKKYKVDDDNKCIGICYYPDEDTFYVYKDEDNLLETNDMQKAIDYYNDL